MPPKGVYFRNSVARHTTNKAKRLDRAEDVVVAEAIGTAVLSIATNPYGRYIWSMGRGGAGSAVRRVNPDQQGWSDDVEADTWTI